MSVYCLVREMMAASCCRTAEGHLTGPDTAQCSKDESGLLQTRPLPQSLAILPIGNNDNKLGTWRDWYKEVRRSEKHKLTDNQIPPG